MAFQLHYKQQTFHACLTNHAARGRNHEHWFRLHDVFRTVSSDGWYNESKALKHVRKFQSANEHMFGNYWML